MQITMLGPLEVRKDDGESVAPSAAKPRQVLAVLALNLGEVVPVSTLVKELWGTNPPRSTLTTLQTYIMQLRRSIQNALAAERGDAAKEVLGTRFGGYVLNMAPDDVDVYRYERLAAAGKRAFDLADYESSSRLLNSALELWRGQALVDILTGPALELEVTRLEESKLSAIETRVDADLAMNRHHSLLSELVMLSARNPLHESLRAKYMIALYRSGRQSDALAAFQDLRNTLIDELGVEPSVRVQRLQQLMLTSDPALNSGCPQELEKLTA